jgi:hypothetical protein
MNIVTTVLEIYKKPLFQEKQREGPKGLQCIQFLEQVSN